MAAFVQLFSKKLFAFHAMRKNGAAWPGATGTER